MGYDKEFRLDTIENYPSAVKAARRVLKEHKKKQRDEINTYRLRVGKTIFCFNSYQKLKNKIREIDTEYEMAVPGTQLPIKKLKL